MGAAIIIAIALVLFLMWRRHGAAKTAAIISTKADSAVDSTKAAAQVAKQMVEEVDIPAQVQKAKKNAQITWRSFVNDYQTERNRMRNNK